MERCAQVQTFREKLLALEEGREEDRLLHEVEWARLLTLSGEEMDKTPEMVNMKA